MLQYNGIIYVKEGEMDGISNTRRRDEVTFRLENLTGRGLLGDGG
jgi:hypothetical protein